MFPMIEGESNESGKRTFAKPQNVVTPVIEVVFAVLSWKKTQMVTIVTVLAYSHPMLYCMDVSLLADLHGISCLESF